MSPQRFNRILLLAVAVFVCFTVAAYAASGGDGAATQAHKALCPRLEDTELLWETVMRKAMMALLRR